MPTVASDRTIGEKSSERQGLTSVYNLTPENSRSELSVIDEQPTTPSAPPYHVFTKHQKMVMLFIVSLGGFFSPLSSNIYFPALGDISKDLNVSSGLLVLTITVYMAVQGIAPSFWAPFADIYGRRVVFICTFSVYLVANIALGVTDNFIALMIFRGLQAAGSAATISIGESLHYHGVSLLAYFESQQDPESLEISPRQRNEAAMSASTVEVSSINSRYIALTNMD
ncbi:hypothetical protein SLS56_002425 [Neofusicoccum ribis]|uniref:Major facilitator superfamily (MFS) profile domain-containing protein n=1 Tax=Neofusicoccum ribis TaxID=45134 RepID=A0ABR3T3P6_9PEZI